MKTQHTVGIIAGVLSMLLVGSAYAQTSDDTGQTDPYRPNLLTPYGMSASIGGGVMGFTDSNMTDFADVGGAWEARLAIGTRRMVGAEVAYTGGAQNITALGLDSNAVLVSTGVEALGRVNFTTIALQPYVIAGVGWRRYDVTNADFNTSSVSDKDNVLEIPMGIGLAYRYRGFVVDARGIFRAAADSDLIQARSNNGKSADLHTWEGSVRLGWEF